MQPTIMTLQANTKVDNINVNRFELANTEELNQLSVQLNAIITINCKFYRINIQCFRKTGVCYERYFVHNKTTYIPLKF